MSINLRQANEKFKIGDSISDDELLALTELYSRLAYNLFCAGEEFGVALCEANRRLSRLQDYVRARGLKYENHRD